MEQIELSQEQGMKNNGKSKQVKNTTSLDNKLHLFGKTTKENPSYIDNITKSKAESFIQLSGVLLQILK